MKIRTDFVTNSSSSSFIICKKFLTNDQIDAIRKHKEIANRMNLYCSDCPWNIEENEMFITGYTSIDNFSMSEFFEIMVALQLFALEISIRLGNDVDMPRNLAKSVTVEQEFNKNIMKRLIWIIALLFSVVVARDLNFKFKFILVLNL